MALTKVRGNTQIKSGTITNVEISANAGIELSKLAEGAELLKRDGSVPLTGNLNLDGNKLINVGEPTNNNDAVRKVDLDSAVSSIQSDLDIVDNRLDVAEGEIDALQAADVVIDGRLDTAEGDIVALEGRMDVAEGDIVALEAADVVIDGRLDAVELKNTEQDGRLDTAEADIVALEGRMDVAESDIVALEAADVIIDGRLDAVELKNTEQDGRLDVAEGDIVALEGRMDTAESDIVALEGADVVIDGRLDAVELKNTEQDGRLDVAEGDITSLESGLAQEILDRQAGVQEAKDYTDQKVSDLVNGAPEVLDTLKELADALGSDENFSTTIAGQISGLDSRLDTAESEIDSLQSGLAQEILDRQAGDQNLQDQIDALDGGLSGDLTALEARVTTAEGDISDLEAADVVIDGRLDAVESKNTEQDGRLDTAEGDIVALEGRMDTAEADIVALEAADVALDGRLDVLELMKDAQMVYVAKSGNDSTGNGGEHAPFLTIQAAMASITDAAASKRYIIKVKGGSYTESGVLNLKANVFIVGEHKDAVRIGATSFGLDSSFSGSADNRSGIANAVLLNACDFNWQTVTSAAGKLYFSDVSFSSTVAMYGHNNAIAQAQFHSCMFFNTFTVSGINVGVHRNNIHYGNINLNQHPNGGMATILVADGGVCSGTVKLTTTVNDFSRRCSAFARSFYMEYLTVDGSSSYCDLTDNSVPRDIARMTKPNGGNIVYINTLSPVDSNSRNIGEPGKQYLFNFNYVNASTGTDLYVISMGNAYSADSSGKSIFIESDSYGLNADVNGGDINLNTAAVSGTGIRGKVKIDARELDLNSKKIVNLADGVALSDAVNKGQLDGVSSDLSADITALDGRMTIAEGDIVDLEAADVALDGRLDAAEADILALESDLAQEILDRQAGVQEAKDYADQKVADLVDGAPEVLDTLKELADALGSDENFSTTIAGQIGALDVRLDEAEADIVALEAADVALDGRLDIAEADIVALESSLGSLDSSVVKLAKVITREIPSGDVDGVNKAFLLGNSVVSDSEHVFLNGLLQEPNSSSLQVVTDIDWEVGVGGDFASLQLALDDANVLPGDNILVKAGTYSVTSTINISKGVRIFGENRDTVIFETAGAGSDPVSMFNVSVNDVVMKDLTIKHKKTSNTSVETAVVVSGPGFPQTRVSGFMMDNCVVEYVEFAVTVRGSDWKIVNSNLSYTGPSNSTRRAIGAYGCLGTCFVKGNSINNNASSGNLRFLSLLSTTGSNPNETYSGKMIVENNTQVSGALQQFISQDSFQGTANDFEMIVKNNSTNETSAFIVFYGTVANFGNILSQLTVSGNTLSNLHGGTPAGGKGIIAVDGAGSGLAFRSSPLTIHASSNVLSNLSFRSDYAEASGSSDFVMGYAIAPIAQPTAAIDASIPSSPAVPETPAMSSSTLVVVENDYGIVGNTITFNSAPNSGDRIRVSYIKQ